MKYIFTIGFTILFINYSISQTQVIPINANCMVYSNNHKSLYATTNANDQNYSQKLLKLNPIDGTVLEQLDLYDEPNRMKLTFDENYIYISFKNVPTIKRVSLENFTVDQTIILEPISEIAEIGIYDFNVIPNTIDEIVLNRIDKTIYGGLYDLILIKNGKIMPLKVPRTISGPFDLNSNCGSCYEICVSNNGKKLYCHNSFSTDFEGYIVNVLDSGLVMHDKWAELVLGFNRIKIHDEIIYSRNGYIIDPFNDSIPIYKGLLPGLFGGDQDNAFTFSEIHNCYIYFYQDVVTSYINFFHPKELNYLGSLYLNLEENIRYPVDIEVVDLYNFAIIMKNTDNVNYIVLHNANPSNDPKLSEIKYLNQNEESYKTIEWKNKMGLIQVDYHKQEIEYLFDK